MRPTRKFTHSFVVAAPLEAVTAFHRRSAGMGMLTPPPVRVDLHAAPALLGEGDEMVFSLRLGPLSIPWRARIERVGPHGFDDRQLAGPFAAWRHRHIFVAVDEQHTIVYDQVEAQPGRGPAGLVGWAIWLSLPFFFAFRTWKTRRLLGRSRRPRTGTKYRTPTDGPRTGAMYRAPTEARAGAVERAPASEGAPLLPLYTAPEDEPFFHRGSEARAALLVHGFLGTPAEMAGLAGLLERRGWTTQAILLPGFGRGIHGLNEQSAAGWLEAVRHAAAELRARYGTLMLVGNSMGAALVLAAAAELPVDAVALTAPFWKVRSWLDLLYPSAAPLIPGEIRPFERLDLSNPLVRAQARQLMPAADFDDPRTAAAVRGVTVATGLLAELGEVGRMGYDAAPYVQAPALVAQGRQDPLVLPRYTARLAARLPHLAELVEVKGDHLISRLESAGADDLRAAFERFAARLEEPNAE